MAKLLCGLIYIVLTILIGWIIWFRKEGREEIQEISHEVLRKRLGFRSDKNQREYKEWWDSLSEEEQAEVKNSTHNPAGDVDNQE